ncbi:Pectinesterase [Heracleum sosnowskyi]|uniref:Pectinesterase n=1 Tax=Heracleum sosnowskyi TaxID=360622 RepID=A0AAD8N0K1_9APIA|nr:Pectinesterase [Heracleum sosnowskyi]
MGLANKVTVIGMSSVVLVAVVVAVAIGVNKGGGGGDGSGEDGAKLSTASKSVKAMCQPCDYKDTCVESLSTANSTDPKELIKTGFEVGVKDMKEVIGQSTTLQESAKDPRTSQAYGLCKELLNTAIDDLHRSFDKVSKFEPSKMNDYVADLKTWLSGVGTYQDTCIDAFQNTSGDAGEKMKKLLKTSSEISSNALAMVSELTSMLSQLDIPGLNTNKERRLLSTDYPEWVDHPQRRLLQSNPKPNAVVAQDGSGQFKTVNEAVKTIPLKNTAPFIIQIKAGVYNEYVEIPRHVDNVVFIGDGATKTKITGNKNFIDGTNTYRTATVAVNGDGFMAKDMGFENSAGADKHQAVALRVSADRCIIYRCQLDGYQDTLYVHTYRQFYRECTITGTIDFIFGDSASVFQSCTMKVRKPLSNQGCMITAQGRKEKRGTGGLILQNCTLTAEDDVLAMNPPPKQYLGRPWKEFSRTIIMQSFIDKNIDPEGWAPWAGDFGLATSYYAEYQNRGPGSDTSKRVKWKSIQTIKQEDADTFTASKFIQGDSWVKSSDVPYDSGMMKV